MTRPGAHASAVGGEGDRSLGDWSGTGEGVGARWGQRGQPRALVLSPRNNGKQSEGLKPRRGVSIIMHLLLYFLKIYLF